MATKRLSDIDGNLAKGTVGTVIVGDDVTPIASDGWYLVKTIAETGSELPAGIQAGYLAYLTTSVTPATGDNVQPVTFTDMCYVQNGSLSFNKDELESTTLCDGIKTYKAGRTDLSGSFDGIFEAGNDEVKELLSRFVDTVSLDASGSTATITNQNDDIYYLQYEMNKQSTANEPVEFFFLPITILTASNGISQGSMQTFTADIRVTADGVNSIKPALYSREVI